MAEIWRLFIAIELPSDVLIRLGALQARLKQQAPPRSVRWVDPTGIHLTLKFLGDVSTTRRDTLQDALAQAVRGHAPFDLATGALGCFPTMRRPRVIWAGIEGDLDALAGLQRAVETLISPLGYPTEDRAFNPHLTLGRVQQHADRAEATRLGAVVSETPVPPPSSWRVNRVSLIRSELKPTGAVYTPLYHADLDPSAG